MKRFFLFSLGVMLCLGALNAQEWQVYDASVLPTDNSPAFSESCTEPGPNTSATIVGDPDNSGNTFLEYLSPDEAGRMAYKIDFEGASTQFTAVIRMRGIPERSDLAHLFDLEFRNGNAGVREKVYIDYANTVELDYGDGGVKVDLGIDVTAWHIYRFVMDGNTASVYVDEVASPIVSGVSENTTSDNQFKIADCSGGNTQASLIDWLIFSNEGAFAPGSGPDIPASLSTATGAGGGEQTKVAFITKDVDPGGNLEEIEFIVDLRSRGYRVDVSYNDPNDISVAPDFDFSYEALHDYDVVILGRGVSSGDFTDAADWAAVETPIIVFSSYLMRNSRMNLVNSSSAARETGDGNTVDPTRVTNIAIADHPVFTGLDADMNGEISYHTWFYDYLVYGADTFEANHNATLLGTWKHDGGPADGQIAVTYWDSGVETYAGSGTILSGKRMYLQMGSDDSNSPKIRNFTAFTEESMLLLQNAIKFLTGDTPDGVEVPVNRPVALWSMSEGSGTMVADAIGSADGEIHNGDGISWVSCGIGNSLDFFNSTKADAIIWVDDNPVVNFNGNQSFSISLWARIDPFANTAEMNLLLKGDNRNDGGHLPDGNGHWYALATKDGELRFAVDDAVTKTQLGVAIDENTFSPTNWNHIVGVRDRAEDSLKLYLNGVLIGSLLDETDEDISTTGLPVVIGNYHSGARRINGNLDEVAIYNRAFTAEQVAEMYAASTTSSNCLVLETISEASPDATLSELSISVGTLEPAFSPDVSSYGVTLPEGTSSVTITATTNHPAATVTGDGEFTNLPGTATIMVTAEDGTTKDYNINFSVEGVGPGRILVEPGFETLFNAIKNANSGDTLVLKNGEIYTPIDNYQINKKIVIIAEEIPELPGLANMPKIENLFATSPLFQLNFGADLHLIGIDVDGQGAPNLISAQGSIGESFNVALYVNRSRLHNTTDDILNDARDGDADQTKMTSCIVKNSFIYDSGAGHGLYVKNYHGESEFVFENLTFWNLGQQFNWIRHFPAGITQKYVYNHMTGYNLSTSVGDDKELFGNSDSETEAALNIEMKNNIFHTQVSNNEGSLKFDNTTGRNTIMVNNNVLYNVKPIVDLGGTINSSANQIDVDPEFKDPDNGDFTVMNTSLHNAADDGKIVGALYWHPDFKDDFSDVTTDIEVVSPQEFSLSNHPNPFKDQTTISFDITQGGMVELTLHDLTGRHIRTLIRGWVASGHHEVTVNAQTLTSGLYLYQLTTNGQSATEKMVINKK